MTMEQLQFIAWLNIGVVFAATIAYFTWRRKLSFPAYRAWFLLLLFIVLAVNSLEGGGLQPVFAWLSSIILLFLTLDILISQGKRLNEKLVTSSMLIVTVVGGILANVYIISVPTSVGARTFSLVVFLLMITPFMFALIAHLKGKRELSKKLLNFVYLGFMKNED